MWPPKNNCCICGAFSRAGIYCGSKGCEGKGNMAGSAPCPKGCECAKHRPAPRKKPYPKCKPNCQCGKHIRTTEHNRRIGEANAYRAKQKRDA